MSYNTDVAAQSELFACGNVLQMIVESARRLEGSPAACCGDRALSYGQLLQAAQVNARRLQARGVRKGDFVLCGLATSVELPVAWLATMIAEAVLVPIDLQWPAARLEAVLQITGAPLAIVPAEFDASMLTHAEQLALFEITSEFSGECAELAVPTLAGDDLLYGFFTSGSTGTPKCALNHHAGIANRFSYMTKRFGRAHRVYQNSAPLFDSSIWQLLWPLTSGGVCFLPVNRDRWSVEAVVDAIDRQQITMTDFVPTLFKALVRSIEHGLAPVAKLHSLRYVLIGGEEIDPLSVHAFRRWLPEVRIINTYGHTEASIGMVFHEVRDGDGDHIPLGAPIDNTYVRIVDEELHEVPDGAFGEIVVAGVCVGAGYLNAPQLTRKAFVPNPFADVPCPMVYRSGDLGRVRPDGLLEFGGRIDDQVKVRGVRIELTELRMALCETCPAIEDACAVVVARPVGDQSLAVAYTARQPVQASLLRQQLASLLPASHLPQFLVHLPEMPVGPNGKTDRREVARRVVESLDQLAALPNVSSSSQQVILQSFREILGTREIEATTHFFEQGGDSLAAVHLSLALQDRLGCDVSAGMIYRFPTPSQLHGALMGSECSNSQALDLPDIVFSNPHPPRQHSRCVLLTGATGFIGIHILERLLTDSDMQVILPVRDLKGRTAAERLAARFHAAFGGRKLPTERLSVITADLSKPALGLSAADWTRLSEHVDEIVHCGAIVNFLSDQDSLFDANVLGTAELIRLCNEGQGKRLHQISSLAVRRIEVAGQPGASDAAAAPAHGYELTKYLADQLIRKAQQQGLAARIYRLDDVLPALRSGHPNNRSFIHLFLKTCLRYRMVVRKSGTIGLLPVDVFAEWICSFVGGAEPFERLPASVNVIAVRHVEFEELVRFVAGDAGSTLVAVDYATFLARLSKDQDKEVLLLRSMLPNDGEQQTVLNMPAPMLDDHSALSLSPWRSRFSLELVDFMPFAHFMMSSMVDLPSPRSEQMA